MRKFINSKRLYWFAGEDPYVLSQCSKGLRRRFSFIGILVLIISLISGVSVAYGVEQILESVSADILIGVYSGLFILILYLFLLHTLSRNVLPSIEKRWSGKLLSYVLRVGFLVFLGILITQPISYFVLRGPVENELVAFKNMEISEFNNRLNIQYAQKLSEVKSTLTSKNQVLQEIRINDRLKNQELRGFIKSQDERDYFIRKILILNTMVYSDNSMKLKVNVPLVISSWMLDLFFISLFVLPVFLKYRISISSEYYRTKRKIETRIIDNHYKKFVFSYNNILRENYPNAKLQYSSTYKDPPYNTVLKSKPRYRNKNQFIKWLLDENN